MLNQGDVVSKTNFKLLSIFIKTSPYRAWLRNLLLELSLELLLELPLELLSSLKLHLELPLELLSSLLAPS